MAAALLDHAAAGRVRVTSAGSQPADHLNPAVVRAMAEIGVDLSREYPQPLTADKPRTMACMDEGTAIDGEARALGPRVWHGSGAGSRHPVTVRYGPVRGTERARRICSRRRR